jgi:hypothetical protein
MKYLISLSVIAAAVAGWFLYPAWRSVAIVVPVVCFAIYLAYGFLKNDPDRLKNMVFVVGFGVTVISWFVSSVNANEQSIRESKRNLRVKFLLDAYFRLQNGDHRDTAPPGNKTFLYDYIYMKYEESATTPIQLLGDPATIRLANQFALSGGKSGFVDLLSALRDDLRKELNLSKLPDDKDLFPTIYREYRTINAPNELTPDQQYQLIIKLNEFDRDLIK